MWQQVSVWSVVKWLAILCWAIYVTGRWIDWARRPKPRTSVRWPNRTLPRPRQQPRSGALRTPEPSGQLEPVAPSVSAVNAFRLLQVATLHDSAVVNRLIAYERGRAPGISRDEAICRAYERWQHDNR